MKPPKFVGVRVGFADRYKVGLWTPLEVTLRGGSNALIGRVRASLSDSDGLNCAFDAPEPCQVLPGQETKVLLYVRFGHETSTLSLELLEGRTTLAAQTIKSASCPRTISSPTPSILENGSLSTLEEARSGRKNPAGRRRRCR